MPQPCYTSLNLAMVRAVRLLSTGARKTGLLNAYQTDQAISIAHTTEKEDGAAFPVKNGSGSICFTYTEPDVVTGATITLKYCRLDPQFVELLTGYPAMTNVTGQVIGFGLPKASAAAYDGVSFEGWSWAWDGDTRAVYSSASAYIRHCWPKVLWSLDDFTLENGPLEVSLTGRCYTNDVLTAARGPAADWALGAGSAGAYLNFLDPSIVVANCGYLGVPTGS